jgi:hypothetical protein
MSADARYERQRRTMRSSKIAGLFRPLTCQGGMSDRFARGLRFLGHIVHREGHDGRQVQVVIAEVKVARRARGGRASGICDRISHSPLVLSTQARASTRFRFRSSLASVTSHGSLTRTNLGTTHISPNDTIPPVARFRRGRLLELRIPRENTRRP